MNTILNWWKTEHFIKKFVFWDYELFTKTRTNVGHILYLLQVHDQQISHSVFPFMKNIFMWLLFLVLLTMQKRCLQKVLVFMNSELTCHTWVYFTQSLHLIQDEKLYLCFCNSSSLKSSKSKRFLFRNQSGRMTLITLSFRLRSRLKHHIQVKCSSKMLTKYSFFFR